MILDTTFLIDVVRGEESVEESVRAIDERGTAHVSSITIMELWEGIHRSDVPDRERSSLEELLSNVREIPFDRECATVAGEVNATLRADGTPIDVEDVMIAATALVGGQAVVTRNVDHFERIDDLELLTY